MKVSLKWLNEYIDLSEEIKQPEKLAARLTEIGFEVEAIHDAGKALQHVLVAQIRERGQHPNADRLTLCQVDVGDGQLRQIVCGAKNHKAGDKVVAALPGAVLPGDFAIKLSKIRDVESQGMLCSEKELGLSAESEGILILPADAPIGTPFAEYQGRSDIIFDIAVSPNRPDVLSHYGMARELSVLLERSLKKSLDRLSESDKGVSPVQVSVLQGELCPRYAGMSFENVKVGPSPAWLKQRLESLDINSVNNVVDITNLVMLELGQPLHAFDQETIRGSEIRVDLSKKGEAFTTFDGSKIELRGQELMIRNQTEPMVIAGVIGNPNSGVTQETRQVFLEAAHFVPETVRRTARELGVETDSAYRFSRGTDPGMIPAALARAEGYLKEICGAKRLGGWVDVQKSTARDVTPIQCEISLVSQRLGYAVEASEFVTLLERMGCTVQRNGDVVAVKPPRHRSDLVMDVDLIEEFARYNGFDRIPEAFPVMCQSPAVVDAKTAFENRLRKDLIEEGLSQVVNYGFVHPLAQACWVESSAVLKATGLELAGSPVSVRNPLSEDFSQMRVSVLPGLFKNVLHNCRYGVERGRLFEIGAVFGKAAEGYKEPWRVGMAIFGEQDAGLWRSQKNHPVVLDLKTVIENLFTRLSLNRIQFKMLESTSVPAFFHPAQTAQMSVEGRAVGLVGTLHPRLRADEKLGVDVAFAELDFDSLMRGQPRIPKLKSLSPHPAVQRDLAFLVPKNQTASAVETVISKVAGPLLQSVEVFDMFEGGSLPADVRSLGFRMILQDAKATLTEATLQELQDKIISQVRQTLGVAMR